eukprot:CAMPEP_0113880682 /NCGR_PEP_ID=MMETSP0780_2-20120614/7927_1 /TAXON_ID=652834 /ORGANISM="Palpitomonas bilix" /LENGTH=124 /DNA_ID=CAMNT_0000867397 /DNA_START=77 /DNA_END=452 /DNA_ORIENTATION=+ /assembly_acc=CAM_ASM_000599
MGNLDFSKACEDKKKAYDSCFNEWYSKDFLKGNAKESPCELEFLAYRECVKGLLQANELAHLAESKRKAARAQNGSRSSNTPPTMRYPHTSTPYPRPHSHSIAVVKLKKVKAGSPTASKRDEMR